ncbi:MAG TPA: mannosyltransferase family protein [Vicinamibacterales bacterium]|jgi:hypothetical protein
MTDLQTRDRTRVETTPRGAATQRFARAGWLLVDVVLLLYVLAVAIWLVTGGIDLRFLKINDVAKPLVVLLLLGPLRLTFGEPSWLSMRVGRLLQPAVALSTTVRARVSPAVADAALPFFASRLAIAAVGALAIALFAPAVPHAFAMPFRAEAFAHVFAAFDSGWYFSIARHGYFFSATGPSSVAFFPLYPLAMHALAAPFGGGDAAIWTAGIVISLTAFALALVEVHRLAWRVCGNRETARRTVLYLAVFPFSFFFSSVYTESLFLLTSVLAYCDADEGKWWRAGIWGALATLTRPNGILIGLPLLILALKGRPTVRELARRGMALALLPAALAGFCAYIYTLSGNPLGWLSAQKQWGYSIGHRPWRQVQTVLELVVQHGLYGYLYLNTLSPYWLIHGVVGVLFLALTWGVFKRLGGAMGAYVLVSLLVPLSGSGLEGIGRYAAVLFPVFMLAGTWRSARLREAILITSALFLALFVSLFVTLHPIY